MYARLLTREVKIGNIVMGGLNPIRIQTMTTTNTMDTAATVAQCIRCIEAGAELLRITAPSKNEAENLLPIVQQLRQRGLHTPIVADIHFTPNAAEVAARIVEKVRINPGNYVDKKKFNFIEYTDDAYAQEIEHIAKRFTPLIAICKQYGTAMRIGTNHGSLSDRIMSRYGDTPMGMVESAMEFLRIARHENYHNIVLSMKSSNPQVMVQANRLLVATMIEEFGECYPLHLGVTEAGDGEDGRIKSAMGIYTLLGDGIGDTIRVSLTEDPEFEIPVCRDIISLLPTHPFKPFQKPELFSTSLEPEYSPFQYNRRATHQVGNVGGNKVPVVIATIDHKEVKPEHLADIGYVYEKATDKWHISEAAADYVYLPNGMLNFALPGILVPIIPSNIWLKMPPWEDKGNYLPLITAMEWESLYKKPTCQVFVTITRTDLVKASLMQKFDGYKNVVLLVQSSSSNAFAFLRDAFLWLMENKITHPVMLAYDTLQATISKQLLASAAAFGGLLIEGMADGVWLTGNEIDNIQQPGRTYLPIKNYTHFLNNTAFGILQAARARISKTEYISCPSCGRTLFDLQEVTAQIRHATHHLKGVKIAIMGCIVNGPGEMADADFGYVGSGPGKITLYKGKEVMKKNVPAETAVAELIDLLKTHGAWIDKPATLQA